MVKLGYRFCVRKGRHTRRAYCVIRRSKQTGKWLQGHLPHPSLDRYSIVSISQTRVHTHTNTKWSDASTLRLLQVFPHFFSLPINGAICSQHPIRWYCRKRMKKKKKLECICRFLIGNFCVTLYDLFYILCIVSSYHFFFTTTTTPRLLLFSSEWRHLPTPRRYPPKEEQSRADAFIPCLPAKCLVSPAQREDIVWMRATGASSGWSVIVFSPWEKHCRSIEGESTTLHSSSWEFDKRFCTHHRFLRQPPIASILKWGDFY